MVSPLAGESASFSKKFTSFPTVVDVCKYLECRYCSQFDVGSHFGDVSVDKSMQVIRNQLQNDRTSAE